MGCKSVTLDLTNDTELNIKIDKDRPLGAEYIIEFENIPNLNGGHKLVLEDEEYTVGDGLTVLDDLLLWSFIRTPFGAEATKLTGYLESQTLTGGDYYKFGINIWIV